MDTNVTNPNSETITSSPVVVSGEGSSSQEGKLVKDPESTVISRESSEKVTVSEESCAVSEATSTQTGEVKETDSREGGRKSPGAVADTIKAFENKIKSLEGIEMSTFQNPSQGNQPPVGDKKEALVSRDTSGLEKEKISSSTPCLLPSAKVTGTHEEPTVIQKATSSPVLPVIKITQIDDVKGEIVIPESNSETDKDHPAQEVSDTPVDASTQSISKEAVKETTSNSEKISKMSPAGSGEGEITNASDPSISCYIVHEEAAEVMDGSEEQSAKISDPSISPVESNEEQTVNASVQTVSPAENGALKNDLENEERKAVFYISSSEIPLAKPDDSSSDTSSLFSQENLGDSRCLGPKVLHVGILLCAIFVAFVSLSCYKLAHEGKMEKVHETAALCVAAIALVIGVFSTLYISFQLCFPVIPDVQYERIGGVEAATAEEGLPRTPENKGVPNTSLQVRKRDFSRPEAEQESDQDSVETLKADDTSEHPVECFTDNEKQENPSSQPRTCERGFSTPLKMASRSNGSSVSSETVTPSKKND